MCNFKFLTVVFISFFSFSVWASEAPAERHINVTGLAELDVKPDQVLIQFQATTLAKKGGVAKQKTDQQVNALLSKLKKAGFDINVLERADIYTRAEYQHNKDQRIFLGIRATRNLRYLLTDLNKVDLFLDTVLSVGIDSIDQLQYGLQSPQKWQIKVREMAVEDSQEKAKMLASAYNAELGDIYSVNYQNTYFRPMMMRSSKAQVQGSTYQVKKIKMTDQVQAVFLLKP